VYPCIIVERIRLQDDRTTRYFLAPDLDYLIIKVEDEDQDGDTMLELKKLY
jgi:nitrogen fixation protein